ncbi:MAG: glycosyltransferase family 8 protein [Alphaproteobacteria bacterium]|nr:glycosyltransferase family 8 protein [Alphaproteobacteria bacterium]
MNGAKEKGQPTVVAYCFDRHFAPYAAVSTLSVITSSKTPVAIYWCVDQRDTQHLTPYIEAIGKKTAAKIHVVPVDIGEFLAWKTVHHFTPATYLRLLLPEVLPLDKLIYIDADTLVLGDLSDLFAIDLGERVLAGVPDPAGARVSKIARAAGDPYLNTGIMLMDTARMRREGSLARCREIYRDFEREITWVDQCIINKYAEHRKLALPEKWNRLCFSNALSPDESKRILSRENTRVLHFLGPIKPWQECCNPVVSSFWWRHADRLGLKGLAPVRITTIEQALESARTLDANAMYREASRTKDVIINWLLRQRPSTSQSG